MTYLGKCALIGVVAVSLSACVEQSATQLPGGTPTAGHQAVAQGFSEAATCQLTNTAENVVLYEGACTVTQSERGNITVFEVQMGSAAPFLFAGRRGESTWMHGPEEVQFTDAPGGGIFRWGNFVLAVAE